MPAFGRARSTAAGIALAALSAAVPLTGATAAAPATPPAAAATAPAASTPAAADPAGAAPARLDPALATRTAGEVRVIVRTSADQGAPEAGAARSASTQRAVRRLGGRVTRELPLVHGFAATLPASAVRQLARTPGVAGVSADRAVQVQSSAWDSDEAPLGPRVLQAPKAWSAGITGRGVTVALLDTGVAPVPDLTERIVPVQDERSGSTTSCYDLSGEGNCDDTFGHGTFMAGLIAGNGASAGGAPTGTAPEARVLSVKVAGADGAADVSTVLAGLQWIVSFRDTYDIRVVNLSLGTDSPQSWEDDPLNYAVERAWEEGIAVIVAAANTGPAPGTIAKPGDDPWVLTVGAVDAQGTPGTGDDRVPDFSSRGPTLDGLAKPDVVAPGARVLSLRVPGSTLDRAFPPADSTSPYRTGSGTSMAAALVSGAAALALQAHPDLTPDRLKHALTTAATNTASDDPLVVGAGLVDAAQTALTPAPGVANVGLGRSSGLGELAGSRGSLSLRLDDVMSTALTGRQTAQLVLWDPLAFTTGSWTAPSWYTSVHGTAGWNGASWTGSDWTGSDWTGSDWTGSDWTGSDWTGSDWTGSSWHEEHEDSSSYGRHGPGSASYGAWK